MINNSLFFCIKNSPIYDKNADVLCVKLKESVIFYFLCTNKWIIYWLKIHTQTNLHISMYISEDKWLSYWLKILSVNYNYLTHFLLALLYII